MLTPTRVYVSVPHNGSLRTEHLDIKRGIFERIQQAGFEPQELKVTGDLAEIPWSFENVQYKLGRCSGAMVLGLVRWDVADAQSKYKFITAYNHFEGALALAAEIPTFVLMHEHVHKSGIVLKGRTPYYVKLPDGVYSAWLQTNDFLSTFNEWVHAVNGRKQVFLGYTGKSRITADQLKGFLLTKGVSVLERELDASFTRDDIERASKSCIGGIFLSTQENENTTWANENLLLATGYFLHAKGSAKMLVILDDCARLPASIQGLHCLSLRNQDDISPIEKDLEKFVIENL